GWPCSPGKGRCAISPTLPAVTSPDSPPPSSTRRWRQEPTRLRLVSRMVRVRDEDDREAGRGSGRRTGHVTSSERDMVGARELRFAPKDFRDVFTVHVAA